jgi:hypothetical protein
MCSSHPERAPIARVQSWHTLTALLLVAVCAVPSRAQAQSPAKGPTPEVVQLTVKGVKNVDQHDLEKSIQTQASRCVRFFF